MYTYKNCNKTNEKIKVSDIQDNKEINIIIYKFYLYHS